jgi:uncharacterized membrane protein YcaP (DUF421 family)
LLIRDGVVLQDDLKRELLTEDQLRCKLRSHGLNDVAQVAEAWLEWDGHVSVIRRKDDASRSGQRLDDIGRSPPDSTPFDGDKPVEPKQLWILATRLERALRQTAESGDRTKSPP